MNSPSARLVRRYEPGQQLVHWIGVTTFGVLLHTGFILLVPSLAFLAAGGFSRLLHRIAAIPFMLLPVVYVALLPGRAAELIRESISFDRDDWAWLKRLPRYLLGNTAGLPPQGQLNAGQKLHHVGTFGAFAAVSGSGLVLWLAKGHLGAAGLAATALVHDAAVLLLVLLLAGHVYFTFVYDAFSAMKTGYVTEEYARGEHRKWLEALPPEAFDDPAAAPPTPRSPGKRAQRP